MTIDELRLELFHEGIREQVILAELAERWKLEAKFQRELSLYGGGASSSTHREPLDVPLSLSGALTSRRHIKDQIMESYELPWRRAASEEDAPIVGVSGCLSLRCPIVFSYTTYSSLCSILFSIAGMLLSS
jgi:hypothetical protein